MVIYLCICNFDIPGVLELPPHDHNQENIAKDMINLNGNTEQIRRILESNYPLRDSIHISVNWKEVARAFISGISETMPT